MIEVVVFVGGTVAGFFAGRWWTEMARGRHDAQRAWRGRKSYRDRD